MERDAMEGGLNNYILHLIRLYTRFHTCPPPSSHLSSFTPVHHHHPTCLPSIFTPVFPPSSHLSTTIIPPVFLHTCPPPSSHLSSFTPVHHHHHTCLPYSRLSTSHFNYSHLSTSSSQLS
ncbi:hypothetical protein Pmani_013664 [Petrolisthes manimaculis]|uniref:Uncharacterized protein n=1 Tax=Petrolisthes manimaculis TaxID=1843537 RepID=A0AAE1PWT2_9EUCA|nr:hypothetical protein Pmani_013664 [Petrolisthes manimaculis]